MRDVLRVELHLRAKKRSKANSLHRVFPRGLISFCGLGSSEAPGARWLPAAWLPGGLASLRVLSAGAFAEARGEGRRMQGLAFGSFFNGFRGLVLEGFSRGQRQARCRSVWPMDGFEVEVSVGVGFEVGRGALHGEGLVLRYCRLRMIVML